MAGREEQLELPSLATAKAVAIGHPVATESRDSHGELMGPILGGLGPEKLQRNQPEAGAPAAPSQPLPGQSREEPGSLGPHVPLALPGTARQRDPPSVSAGRCEPQEGQRDSGKAVGDSRLPDQPVVQLEGEPLPRGFRKPSGCRLAGHRGKSQGSDNAAGEPRREIRRGAVEIARSDLAKAPHRGISDSRIAEPVDDAGTAMEISTQAYEAAELDSAAPDPR